jgi:hypothetical protein
MAEDGQSTTGTADGRHDFDFIIGTWANRNRKRVRPLVEGDTEWIEFDSRFEARPILDGLGNAETFEAPNFPGRPGFEGFTLRLSEPETGLWRIWWVSTIGGGRLDEPVVGRFENGVGRFECDDVVDGVPLRVRYDWTDIGAESITWTQSFSFDAGQTWDPNWITTSTRIS